MQVIPKPSTAERMGTRQVAGPAEGAGNRINEVGSPSNQQDGRPPPEIERRRRIGLIFRRDDRRRPGAAAQPGLAISPRSYDLLPCGVVIAPWPRKPLCYPGPVLISIRTPVCAIGNRRRALKWKPNPGAKVSECRCRTTRPPREISSPTKASCGCSWSEAHVRCAGMSASDGRGEERTQRLPSPSSCSLSKASSGSPKR